MTEPTDDFAFALGLVDRPGVPPAVARELATSIVAYAREFAAEELRKAAEWAATVSPTFPAWQLQKLADALATDDRTDPA